MENRCTENKGSTFSHNLQMMNMFLKQDGQTSVLDPLRSRPISRAASGKLLLLLKLRVLLTQDVLMESCK